MYIYKVGNNLNVDIRELVLADMVSIVRGGSDGSIKCIIEIKICLRSGYGLEHQYVLEYYETEEKKKKEQEFNEMVDAWKALRNPKEERQDGNESV